MRLVVRSSMALVALAAAALSYQSLMALAELAGYGALSVLYPLVVDAGAAASCAAWLHTRGRQPLLMTWCLLAVSVVLNGTTHYLESTHTAPSWLLVVAVAAVPPTVLGLCVHLAVGTGGPGQPGAPTPLARASTSVAETEATGHVAASHQFTTGHTSHKESPDQLTASGGSQLAGPISLAPRGPMSEVPAAHATPEAGGVPFPSISSSDQISELLAQGAGRRRIASELGISEHQARQLLAARNGDGR